MNASKIVRITPKAEGKKTLSAAQKQFNSLTKKIDRQKKLLIEWKETVPLYIVDPIVQTNNALI
ncbi:hypothetical protein [Methylobacter svalbardensis]|uniref:hypothetical protein n=1 Tax=Methylobacter svalbardensis TaxID=3080016 RepID=UPI0030EB79F1